MSHATPSTRQIHTAVIHHRTHDGNLSPSTFAGRLPWQPDSARTSRRAFFSQPSQRRLRLRRIRSVRKTIVTLSLCFFTLFVLSSVVSAEQLYTTDGVNIRSMPSADSDVYIAVPAGTAVTRTGQSGNWIAVNVEGVNGYIYKDYLSKTPFTSPSSASDTVIDSVSDVVTFVNSTEVNLRKKANSHCKILCVLNQGESVTFLSTKGNWTRIRRESGEEGYVYSIYLGDNKPSSPDNSGEETLSREDIIANLQNSAISYAENRLGDTYSQELRDTEGYADCSSLVRDAFQSASGVFIGNTTTEQAALMRGYLYDIDKITDAEPGDLLYHLSGDHHTGIYLGNGQVLHSSQRAGMVTLSSYDSNSTYWEYGCRAADYCCDNTIIR